jgi:hypothetical protein
MGTGPFPGRSDTQRPRPPARGLLERRGGPGSACAGMMARLFALTVLVYPVVLALLCLGTGLLVDRGSGRFLPAALLPAVGAAGLIALSQLTTYLSPLAPATPYLMATAAVAGFLLARSRIALLLARARSCLWLALVPVLAYLLALAPVLLAGRPSFSSYMALSDSALHMIGADYLIHHGQDYAHLDLSNSYGQFIDKYYNTSYPSGADTLFGGSALLLGLPLIWAFQPFNAFMLALASGPAWLLARRIGLTGPWAALAALTATVPALVYSYELFGSIKEITALPMILALGALAILHRRWLFAPHVRAIPFALVLAGGISALGVGFGAWALAAAAVPFVVVMLARRAGHTSVRRMLPMLAVGVLVLLIAAWPTWVDLPGSLEATHGIATTDNAGNLHAPLHWTQAFGVWLRGSYKQSPVGTALTLTHVLVAITIAACALGAFHLLRTRRFALAGWLALMLLLWLVLSGFVGTWVGAKTLMITSPAIVLLACAGVAALRARGPNTTARPAMRLVAALLALVLAGGVLASDIAQYHSSNLAPTARYDELAHINSRFAGRGPAMFTDFDEYSLYQLRDLDVGAANFIYQAPAFAGVTRGYGQPVDLNRVSPAALRSYPLIVTRRNPTASPPPSVYRLLWQGRYYQVWGRRPGVPPASLHVALSATRPACARVRRLARLAATDRARLLAAVAPEVVRIPLRHLAHPAGWGHQRAGFAMRRPGRLFATFTVPHAGVWRLWLQGQFMPAIGLSIDGRSLASISGQLGGNSLIPDTTVPVPVRLSAGPHKIAVARRGFSPAPGNGGLAVLDSIFLTPAHTPARELIESAPGANPRSLCGRSYDWIEFVPA